jgi:HD-GYP domain-containing protein (c-di-GMP phosphodiesterase class II)
MKPTPPHDPDATRQRLQISSPQGAIGTPVVRVSELLGALSFALDLTEGQPFGHALRTCLIGMRIAERLDLPLQERRDLYFGSLLKDVGCSSSAARVYELFAGDDLSRLDWNNYFKAAQYAGAQAEPGSSWFERARRIVALAKVGSGAAVDLVEARCKRSAAIVEELGFGSGVAAAVASLEEQWDGRGQPHGLKGSQIPLTARILGFAQSLDAFAALDGARSALAMAVQRRGKCFDPNLVDASEELGGDIDHWCALNDVALQHAVREAEPGDASLLVTPAAMDRILRGFAHVVDVKSPYTAQHSARVAAISVGVASALGFEGDGLGEIRRAALLHDIGKLSVPNSILDKPGPLSAHEWEVMRLHPYYTQRILERISGFETLAFVASSHHERLDGQGYYRGLRDQEIPRQARVLVVSDIYEALTTDRPYRPGMKPATALALMERDRDVGLAGDCLDALAYAIENSTIEEQQRAA